MSVRLLPRHLSARNAARADLPPHGRQAHPHRLPPGSVGASVLEGAALRADKADDARTPRGGGYHQRR